MLENDRLQTSRDSVAEYTGRATLNSSPDFGNQNSHHLVQFLAACFIKSGVSKSGSPKLSAIISCPSACNSRLIRAIAKVADSANRFSLSETFFMLLNFLKKQRYDLDLRQ